MHAGTFRKSRWILGLCLLAVAAGLVAANWPRFHAWAHPKTEIAGGPPAPPAPHAQLVAGRRNVVSVPEAVVRLMRVSTVKVRLAPPPEPLQLDGSLFLDANNMVHIRTRFAGEVVELGDQASTPAGEPDPKEKTPGMRSIRFGDEVKKGQLLAVVWSKELGEKKSELVQSLAQLRLGEEKLKRLEESWSKGAIPERSVREAERQVESDMISVSRAERTLRSWRLTDDEIQIIRTEAESIHGHKGHWNKDLEATWARVEIRSPIDGTILEKNVAVGDVMNIDQDMFKVADLTRLDVLAHVYEDDLPELERLRPEQRRWTIFLKADPHSRPMEGSFEQIGNIIDPNQHTALIMGWADNRSGRLRIGQFVTAQIDLPADTTEVAIPAGALVDQDGEQLVFVTSGADSREFECRHVVPSRRRDDMVYLKGDSATLGTAGNAQSVSIDEWVVTSGGIELAAELKNLKAKQPTTSTSSTQELAGEQPVGPFPSTN